MKFRGKKNPFCHLDWFAEMSMWLSLAGLIINIILTIIRLLSHHAAHFPPANLGLVQHSQKEKIKQRRNNSQILHHL